MESRYFKVFTKDDSMEYDWAAYDEVFSNKNDAIEFVHKVAQTYKGNDFKVAEVYESIQTVYWYDHVGAQ